LRDRYVRYWDGELLGALNDEFLFGSEDLECDIRVNVFQADTDLSRDKVEDGVYTGVTTVDFVAGGDVPEMTDIVALAAEDTALEQVRTELPAGASVEVSGGDESPETGDYGRGYTWRLRREYTWKIPTGTQV